MPTDIPDHLLRADPALADLVALQRRRTIRSSLDAWARACDFTPALHHRLINEKLEAVDRGEIQNLAIFLPPGAAKSTYGSVLDVPWFLQRVANRVILALSHTKDLVQDFGRKCRNLIDLHAKELGISLLDDMKAMDNWGTSNGGSYSCFGVGAKIAGRRADILLLDDVIGSKEDAESKQHRDKVWSWYLWDVVPRLKPNARKIMIQTRWHMEDLAGKLLHPDSPFCEADKWTVINIPLIAETNDPLGRLPGERLWPEWFNDGTEANARMDPDAFNCLWQQNPTPETGNYFKSEWLQTYRPGDLPSSLRKYACSDHALGKREENDETVLVPLGVDASGDIWVLPDVVWSKFNSMEACTQMLDMEARHNFIYWWAGKEHITTSIRPFLDKFMQERGVYLNLIETPSLRDLVSRAQPIRNFMALGRVHFPAYAPWWPKAKAQLLAFDKGTHDDFVAALSEGGRGLADQIKAERPPPPEVITSTWTPTMRWIKETEAHRKAEVEYRRLDR